MCGRDTPDANLYAMVAAASELGTYPLDMGRIRDEIGALERGRVGGVG